VEHAIKLTDNTIKKSVNVLKRIRNSGTRAIQQPGISKITVNLENVNDGVFPALF
jgi:hypothetical protein